MYEYKYTLRVAKYNKDLKSHSLCRTVNNPARSSRIVETRPVIKV